VQGFREEGSVLIWILAVGLALSLVYLNHSYGFKLKTRGYSHATNQIASNLHQRAAFPGYASVDDLAVDSDPQAVLKVLLGLRFRDIQSNTGSVGFSWKQDYVSYGVKPRPIWQVAKESEGSPHSKRETAFVQNIEFYRQSLWLLRKRTNQLNYGSLPVRDRNPLGHGSLHEGRLAFDSSKGTNGGIHATPADYHQTAREDDKKSSENDTGHCETERPSIAVLLGIVFGLTFGGLLGAIWAGVGLDDKRRVLRASLFLFGLGCSEFGLLFLLATGFYPYTWGLPPQWLPTKWNPCPKDYRQYFPHGQNVSQKVLTRSYFPYYNNYMANILSTDKQTAIIGALAEGSSIRSIERITGVHRDTIMRLGVRVGQGCAALMDQKMQCLSCNRIEMDEIWGFVGKKERHLRVGDDPQFGNVWTFCAIDAETKLVPAFKVVGFRDVAATNEFVANVAGWMKNRVQLSTDGFRNYAEAVEIAFGGNVDYGQIIKTYGTEQSVETQRRYSAPEITAIEKKSLAGRPDFDLISTSYIERLNATTRLHMKRLARLTHAFSKKRENFEAAVGLHFAYYNFVRRHNTLRCTPAMAAGVTATYWTVEDLVRAA